MATEKRTYIQDNTINSSEYVDGIDFAYNVRPTPLKTWKVGENITIPRRSVEDTNNAFVNKSFYFDNDGKVKCLGTHTLYAVNTKDDVYIVDNQKNTYKIISKPVVSPFFMKGFPTQFNNNIGYYYPSFPVYSYLGFYDIANTIIDAREVIITGTVNVSYIQYNGIDYFFYVPVYSRNKMVSIFYSPDSQRITQTCCISDSPNVVFGGYLTQLWYGNEGNGFFLATAQNGVPNDFSFTFQNVNISWFYPFSPVVNLTTSNSGYIGYGRITSTAPYIVSIFRNGFSNINDVQISAALYDEDISFALLVGNQQLYIKYSYSIPRKFSLVYGSEVLLQYSSPVNSQGGSRYDSFYSFYLFIPEYLYSVVIRRDTNLYEMYVVYLFKEYPDLKGKFYNQNVLVVRFRFSQFNPSDGTFSGFSFSPQQDVWIETLDYFSLFSNVRVYDTGFSTDYHFLVKDLAYIPFDIVGITPQYTSANGKIFDTDGFIGMKWIYDISFSYNSPSQSVPLDYANNNCNIMTGFYPRQVCIISDETLYPQKTLLQFSYPQNINDPTLKYTKTSILYPPTKDFALKVVYDNGIPVYNTRILQQDFADGTLYRNIPPIHTRTVELLEDNVETPYSMLGVFCFVRNKKELVFCYPSTLIPEDVVVFDSDILGVADAFKGYGYVFTKDGVYLVSQEASGYKKIKLINLSLYQNPDVSRGNIQVNGLLFEPYVNMGGYVIFVSDDLRIFAIDGLQVSEVLYFVSQKLKNIASNIISDGDIPIINFTFRSDTYEALLSIAPRNALYSVVTTQDDVEFLNLLTRKMATFVITSNMLVFNLATYTADIVRQQNQNSVIGVFSVGFGDRILSLIGVERFTPFITYNLSTPINLIKIPSYVFLQTINSSSSRLPIDFVIDDGVSVSEYYSNPPFRIAPTNEAKYLLKFKRQFSKAKLTVFLNDEIDEVLGLDYSCSVRTLFY